MFCYSVGHALAVTLLHGYFHGRADAVVRHDCDRAGTLSDGFDLTVPVHRCNIPVAAEVAEQLGVM